MRAGRTALMVLGGLVIASALAIVYAKHESRKLFVELQGLQAGRDNINIEWGRLQLEQSTWAAHGRVESIAVTRLGMRMPQPGDVVIVRP